MVRVTGGHRPPPSGWAAGQVCAGLHAICGLEMLNKNKQIDKNQILLHSLIQQLKKVPVCSVAWLGVDLVGKPDTGAHLSHSLKREKVDFQFGLSCDVEINCLVFMLTGV